MSANRSLDNITIQHLESTKQPNVDVVRRGSIPMTTYREVKSEHSMSATRHANGIADGENLLVDELEITDGDAFYPDENVHKGWTTSKIVRSVREDEYHRNISSRVRSVASTVDSISSEPVNYRKRTKPEQTMHRHEWLTEHMDPSSYIPQAYDYWTLPRNRELYRRYNGSSNVVYQTPGGMLFSRKAHNRQSGRRSHRHRSAKESKHSSLSDRLSTKHRTDSENYDVSPDDQVGISPHRSELKVYFRFSKGTLGEGVDLDFLNNESLLLSLQAHCRGWLARQRFQQRAEEDLAVRIIQRNSERAFNPWFRLFLAIRPLLKSHRMEEELLFLKSELERYKALVKMLRFENAQYQAKVANLLHLIEQINAKGTESDTVNHFIQQISDALTKNQEFWQEMAVSNRSLQAATLPRPIVYNDPDGSPTFVSSPMTQLRNDADFYRNQVDMLKEEADEQQHRSSEHFQGQVSVLSDRMEHLQNLLALESSKVERLSAELEEMNGTVTEARAYERNLEHMVSQLSKQLEQRTRVAEVPPSPLPPAMDDDKTKDESKQNMEQQLHSYRNVLSQLRVHLSANPKAMSVLSNTPFQPGGEMDLFQEPRFESSQFITLSPLGHRNYFAAPMSPDRQSAGELTPRAQVAHEVAELKRQLTMAESTLKETGERIKGEIEDRESAESENVHLHGRICALDRQMKLLRDEFEETMSRRELSHQRELKELADHLDEEQSKNARLAQHNKDLERDLSELRLAADADENLLTDELESLRSKLRADLAHYKRSCELIQEEFDEYRKHHDPMASESLITEKEERIDQLEREKQQWRMESDVQQVKLQNATSLLEETEKRLKMVTRERTAQLQRITLLETERDAAIREAATMAGRSSAEKENIATKLREYEDLRVEHESLRRELAEVKQTLAGCTAEIAAEKRQAQARLRDLNTHQEIRVGDLKAELDRAREEVERLQNELLVTQTSESEQKSSIQQSRWKIGELEDKLSHMHRRIGTLERQNTDLEAELIRAKADLSASREAASLRRAARTRIADEWLQGSGIGEDTEDEELNKSFLGGINKYDYGNETFSEDSEKTPQMRRTRLGGSFRSSSLYRSNPALYRSLGQNGRSLSVMDRNSIGRSSSNILDRVDDGINLGGKSRIGRNVTAALARDEVQYVNSLNGSSKVKATAQDGSLSNNDSDTVGDSEA